MTFIDFTTQLFRCVENIRTQKTSSSQPPSLLHDRPFYSWHKSSSNRPFFTQPLKKIYDSLRYGEKISYNKGDEPIQMHRT